MTFRIKGNFHSRSHALAVSRKVRENYWANKKAEKAERLSKLRQLLSTGEPVDLAKELLVSKDTIIRYLNGVVIPDGFTVAELTDGRFQLRSV